MKRTLLPGIIHYTVPADLSIPEYRGQMNAAMEYNVQGSGLSQQPIGDKKVAEDVADLVGKASPR